MPILVNCRCGQSYSVRDEFAGQPVQCVTCGQVVLVPAPLPPPPPSSGPRLRQVPGIAPFLPQPSAPRQGAPVAAFGLMLLLGAAGVLFVMNFDRIQELFGSREERQARVEPEERPDKLDISKTDAP